MGGPYVLPWHMDKGDTVEDRLRHLLTKVLVPAIHRERVPLDLAAYTPSGEPISFEAALAGDYRPIEVGDRWGPPWGTTWFHVRGRVPPGWSGGRPVVVIDLGFAGQTGFSCEGLAWRDGRPWRGLSPNHRWLPVEGTEVDFRIEAAANPAASVSGPGRAPSMIERRQSREPIFAVRQADLALRDEELRRVMLDFRVLLELALAMPVEDHWRTTIVEALERFAARVDADRVAETAHDAARELNEILAQPKTSTGHRITAVGHAHIDTAWLWPLREGRRKCTRTFATAIALMDEYPEHHFACSQAAQYAWVKESHPELFERIRTKTREGQWEPVGSMWVEADCNLPSGESLVRQLVHGKRFFIEELGYEPVDVWLPDVFGFPASLPQLIAEAGCRFFLTQKLSWNQLDPMPHHTFWWEGLDGTRVFTHFPPANTYNGSFGPEQVLAGPGRFRDGEASDRSLYLFGWGDGGGGPEPDMIETARRLARLAGAPDIEIGRARDFFESAAAEASGLAIWVGEMYLELHRGTYTTQARTKRLNRMGEQALRAAELWSLAAARFQADVPYPSARLEEAWRTLLLHQFHDILPGSSIDWVYADAERDLAEVVSEADRLATDAREGLAGSDPESPKLAVFNVTSHHRREIVEHAGGHLLVEAPPCGWAVQTDQTAPSGGPVRVGQRFMENDLLRAEWDETGQLTSLSDLARGREVLAAGARGNVLELYVDKPEHWDAWDIDLAYRESRTEVRGLIEEAVELAGPLRASVRFGYQLGASHITQHMVLDAGSRILKFETEVDWQEEHRLLKVAFPVSIRSSRASYEIQFGHVERPTHANTSWDLAKFEVCAHRWADLGEAGYGVALLNDCKYGHDIHGSEMRLTLLRAPTHPDPTADRGRHRFTYALMPHPGDFRAAGVIQAAEDLNVPLRLVPTTLPAGSRRSLVEVDTPQVVVETVKRAEASDAIVIRLYEAWGGRCRAGVRCSLPFSRAWTCDLLERERTEVSVVDGGLELELLPFKVVTLKLL